MIHQFKDNYKILIRLIMIRILVINNQIIIINQYSNSNSKIIMMIMMMMNKMIIRIRKIKRIKINKMINKKEIIISNIYVLINKFNKIHH